MSQPAKFANQVIRASAGTGKTFQLSNRFLGLVAAGLPPDQILATTFARKAAGEILERVMTRLAESIEDGPRLAELARHLKRSSLDRTTCLWLLRGLLQQLHRLQIGTLDSFFVKLAGSFSLELGLPLGWRIIDPLDDDKLRAEAIRRMLETNPATDSVGLVHLLSKGEATRSVTRQVEDVVKGLYDLYLASDREHWEQLPRLKPLDDAAVRDALTQLSALDDFPTKQFAEAHQKHLRCAEIGDWDSFICRGLVGKMICGTLTYNRTPIEAHIVDAYRPLVEHARAELTNRLANQTEGTWQMLSHYDAAYRKLKSTERAMRFDDVTRALAFELNQRGVEDLAYRLDGPLAHLLFDEFQDTSKLQWDVLLPFAKRATLPGGGRSFFCVGDAKQAIYGWRGGVAEIFDSAIGELSGIEQQSLVTSYRSSPVVIDTVNAVFGSLLGNEALADWPEVASEWHKRYTKHTTAKAQLRGRCRLLVARRAADPKQQCVATLQYAAAHVAALAAEHPTRTIGVLVRRNSAVARLIYELRTAHDVRASEEGGIPLTDSPAVQLVLSLLKLADHPGDTAARFHVAKSPLGAEVGLDRFDDNERARALALEIRDRLVADGYGRTLYGWVKLLAPSCELRDLNRLLQLVELAYRFDDGRVRRPDDFIARIEAEKVEDPTAAKVRVMTVHQAKGLEFDIVVLPELDVAVKGQPPLVVVDRENPLAPARAVCRYAGESIQKLLPARFQKMFADWDRPWLGESLCVLYVAMTRAIHALDMIIAPPKPNGRSWPKTYAGIVRSALAPDQTAEPETTLYEHGEPEWWKAETTDRDPARATSQPSVSVQADGPAMAAPVAHAAAPETVEVKLRATTKRRRGLDYRTPSGLEGCGKVDLGRRLRLDSVAAMTRGSILHAWFERINWLEDGVPDDAELLRIAGPIATPDIDVTAEIKRFRAMLARPIIAAAVSRSGYADLAKLGFSRQVATEFAGARLIPANQREQSFAVRRDDALVFGTVDRITFFRDGGRLAAVDVLDFKTDAVRTPEEMAERVAVYRPQLLAYRESVAALTGLDQKYILARLLFVEPGSIEIVGEAAIAPAAPSRTKQLLFDMN